MTDRDEQLTRMREAVDRNSEAAEAASRQAAHNRRQGDAIPRDTRPGIE